MESSLKNINKYGREVANIKILLREAFDDNLIESWDALCDLCMAFTFNKDKTGQNEINGLSILLINLSPYIANIEILDKVDKLVMNPYDVRIKVFLSPCKEPNMQDLRVAYSIIEGICLDNGLYNPFTLEHKLNI